MGAGAMNYGKLLCNNKTLRGTFWRWGFIKASQQRLEKSCITSDKKLYLADTFTGVIHASEMVLSYFGWSIPTYLLIKCRNF
jgi:hypothetical protein